MSDYVSIAHEGLEVEIRRSEVDGRLIVSITGPDEKDATDKSEPDIRIWLNEALIYKHGEVGDDLSEGGEKVAAKPAVLKP